MATATAHLRLADISWRHAAARHAARPAARVGAALAAGDAEGARALVREAILSGLDEGLPAVSLYWCHVARGRS